MTIQALPQMNYFAGFGMSFTEVLQELPTLTVSERQLLIRPALELDELAD